MADFGDPSTWEMNVDQFIDSGLPKEKPQELLDLQEQNRKQRLLQSLQKIGGRLEDSSLDFIRRENFGVKGTSKILPKLNSEAQEEFGKNWDKLNADDKQRISARVRAREAYQKVDPTEDKTKLKSKATEKKLKDFAAKFKKENKRVPMMVEIKNKVGTSNEQIKKYLKQSEYATPEQALKFKTPKKAKAIPDEMKDWFKENYPNKDWNDDLSVSERVAAKKTFDIKDNPAILSRKELKKLGDYLNLKKKEGTVLLEGGLEDIAKAANADLTPMQTRTYISNNFPNTFNYKGNVPEGIPAIRNRIAELSKTLPDKEIYEKLVEENLLAKQKGKPDYRMVSKIMKQLKKEGKIDEILKNPSSGYTLEEQTLRDNLVKNYIDKNPDVDNAFQIAKGIVRENPELKMSSNFVKGSVERQKLESVFKSRHAKIFPEVQALDKIIKNIPELKAGEEIPKKLKEKVLIEYAEATGKNIAQAEGELVSRMRKLGTLYAGDVGRYETDLYKKIKIPKNYKDSNFQKNFINLTDKTGVVSNMHMAKLLGLPKSEQKLIQGTANMFSAFDFDVAGDHTDIKAMMRDFPSYKKNFSRIEYIKDTLNDFKQTYDSRINALRKAAQNVTGQAQQNLLDEANEIAREFESKTGYRVGTFDLKKGRVVINPQTLRLPDLKNPYNETLQQAMENFEQTKNPKLGGKAATKPEKFTGLDKRLMEADASERVKIFKDVAGTPEAKESLYIRALQKIPKIGPLATKLIAGTAGAAAVTTLAQADEPGVETSDDFPTGKVAAGAAAAPLATKKGRSIYGKAGKGLLKMLSSPTAAAGFGAYELGQGNTKLAGASLLAPEVLSTLAPAGKGILSRAGSILMNPFGKAARAFTPVGLATIAGGAGYDVYKEIKRRQDLTDEERLQEDIEAQARDDEMMVGAAEGGRIGYADGTDLAIKESLEAFERYLKAGGKLGYKDFIALGNEGVSKFFNAGGRVGFADGPDDPKRRTFMKVMAGIASLPILGKFFKPAVPLVKKLSNTTTKMPDWFPNFVDRFMNKGIGNKIDADLTEYSVKELPDVKLLKQDNGAIRVEGKNAYNEEYYIDYEPPGVEVVDYNTGKTVKTKGDFVATDTEYRMISPEDYDVDGVNVDEIDDILGGSSTKLEGFAKGTNKEKYTIGQRRIDEADARGASKDESLRADINDPYGDIDPTDFTDD